MDPVSSLGLGRTEQVTTASQGLAGLDGDAFMQLMVAQLRYQDPLAPTDTHGLLQQTSALAQTELMTKVTQMQQQLLGLQQASVAHDLIGSDVQGLGPGGDLIAGTVDAVRFDTTGPVLLVGDQELALVDATRIGGKATSGPSADTNQQPDTSLA